MVSQESRHVYRPFSFVYFLILFVAMLFVVQSLLFGLRELLIQGLGFPPEYVGTFLFLSLFGSFVNLPLGTIESKVPVVRLREASAFGVTWLFPEHGEQVQRIMVAANLGGAVVPIATSMYLLAFSIPAAAKSPAVEYLAAAVVLAAVSLFVNRVSTVVPGLGVASPALAAPLATALVVVLVDFVLPLSCPAQVAYVGGTLGTLIGADLMNLGRVREVGAAYVSIGGAGTFDGVYLTGLMSVMLVLLLL